MQLYTIPFVILVAWSWPTLVETCCLEVIIMQVSCVDGMYTFINYSYSCQNYATLPDITWEFSKLSCLKLSACTILIRHLWGHLHMIWYYTNWTLVQTVAIYWYCSGQTGQISNTCRIFKCILYCNDSTAFQNVPLNSISFFPSPKIQITAILILERLCGFASDTAFCNSHCANAHNCGSMRTWYR